MPNDQTEHWQFFCSHANENPNICPCPATCGCRRTSMCQNKSLPTTGNDWASRMIAEVKAQEIARIAMDFHRNIEGEYGCHGVTCPGVQRLIQKFTALDGVGVADWVKQANSQSSASTVHAEAEASVIAETEPPPTRTAS